MLGEILNFLLKGSSNLNNSNWNKTNWNNTGWNNSNGITGSDFIDIQLQDTTGNWRTYHTTQNNSQMIVSEMRNLASNYPGSRVRAVDQSGRLIDIL